MSQWRGHEIYQDAMDLDWHYVDTDQLVRDNPNRRCGSCGRENTPEGHDGCLGTIPGVVNACCGHGVVVEAYAQYTDGTDVRGFAAWEAMRIRSKTGRIPVIMKLPDLKLGKNPVSGAPCILDAENNIVATLAQTGTPDEFLKLAKLLVSAPKMAGALRFIADHVTTEEGDRDATEEGTGIDYQEAVEMAHDNIILRARAIVGEVSK